MKDMESSGALHLPARDIPIPAFLSDTARGYLMPQPATAPYPALTDKNGWRDYVTAADQSVIPLLRHMSAQLTATVEERDISGARVFDIVPPGLQADSRGIVLVL